MTTLKLVAKLHKVAEDNLARVIELRKRLIGNALIKRTLDIVELQDKKMQKEWEIVQLEKELEELV